MAVLKVGGVWIRAELDLNCKLIEGHIPSLFFMNLQKHPQRALECTCCSQNFKLWLEPRTLWLRFHGFNVGSNAKNRLDWTSCSTFYCSFPLDGHTTLTTSGTMNLHRHTNHDHLDMHIWFSPPFSFLLSLVSCRCPFLPSLSSNPWDYWYFFMLQWLNQQHESNGPLQKERSRFLWSFQHWWPSPTRSSIFHEIQLAWFKRLQKHFPAHQREPKRKKKKSGNSATSRVSWPGWFWVSGATASLPACHRVRLAICCNQEALL